MELVLNSILTNRPKVKPVDTLPADGSSSPVVLLSTDGKVYLWGKVIELNGPDTFNTPVIQNMLTDDWEITDTYTDLGAAEGAFSSMRVIKKGSIDRLYFRLDNLGKFNVSFRTLDGASPLVTVVVAASPVLNQKRFRVTVKKTGVSVSVTVYVDGTTTNVTQASLLSTYAWDGDGITSSIVQDSVIHIRPLQVCCIQQLPYTFKGIH